MRIYYAGFYNLKPEYLKPLVGKIEVLHVLRSYYYKSDLTGFMKKMKEFGEKGEKDASRSEEDVAEPADVRGRGGEGGVPQ